MKVEGKTIVFDSEEEALQYCKILHYLSAGFHRIRKFFRLYEYRYVVEGNDNGKDRQRAEGVPEDKGTGEKDQQETNGA